MDTKFTPTQILLFAGFGIAGIILFVLVLNTVHDRLVAKHGKGGYTMLTAIGLVVALLGITVLILSKTGLLSFL